MAEARRAAAVEQPSGAVKDFFIGALGGVVGCAIALLVVLLTLGIVFLGIAIAQHCDDRAPRQTTTTQLDVLENQHLAIQAQELETEKAQWEAKRWREEYDRLKKSTAKPAPTKPATPKTTATKRPSPDNTAGGNNWFPAFCRVVDPQHPVTCPDRHLR